jgi:hypothetical protein
VAEYYIIQIEENLENSAVTFPWQANTAFPWMDMSNFIRNIRSPSRDLRGVSIISEIGAATAVVVVGTTPEDKRKSKAIPVTSRGGL